MYVYYINILSEPDKSWHIKNSIGLEDRETDRASEWSLH